MEHYQEELDQIKSILRENPKGMTVTDIARKINTNRNSVAKYLDILLISGHVEMISFGPAKVFFPSRRVPLIAMLNFVSDCILVLDEHLTILQVNDAFLTLFNTERGTILNKNMETTLPYVFVGIDILTTINEALNGKECTNEFCLPKGEEEFYFILRLIPTTFEDGKHGVTIILTNITEKKRIETALHGKKKIQNNRSSSELD